LRCGDAAPPVPATPVLMSALGNVRDDHTRAARAVAWRKTLEATPTVTMATPSDRCEVVFATGMARAPLGVRAG